MAFGDTWRRFISSQFDLCDYKIGHVRPALREHLSPLIKAATDECLTATDSIEQSLVEVERAGHIALTEQIERELMVAIEAATQAHTARKVDAALGRDGIIIDSIKDILEKGFEKLPLLPWLALELLKEGIDLVKSVAFRAGRPRRRAR